MLNQKYLITILTAVLLNTQLAAGQAQQEKKKLKPINPVIVMKTSMGTIKIELFLDKAPISVNNFLGYVDEKFYDSTAFHRVINNFMIQGGGFAATEPLKQKSPKSPIKNEASNGLKNERGTIAMARTNDPNSATSQFFINVKDNANLNPGASDPHGYAVFGKVIEGMDVVDKIKEVKTGKSPVVARAGENEVHTVFTDVPQTKVIIESIRRATPKTK